VKLLIILHPVITNIFEVSRLIKSRKSIPEFNKVELKLSKVFKVNKSFIRILIQSPLMLI